MKINIIVFCLAIILGIKLFDYQYNRINTMASNNVNGYKNLSTLEKDLLCLSNNIYMETGVSDIESKLAVAIVTMNRVKSKKFGDSVCEVVYQNKQFSWTIDTPQNRKNFLKRNPRQYKDSEEVAKKVLLTGFDMQELDGVYFYHADYVKPKWDFDKLQYVCKIGKHLFYRTKNGKTI